MATTLKPKGPRFRNRYRKALPRTLSGWILEAVEDALLARKMQNRVLDMCFWNSVEHNPETGQEVCRCCLAGVALLGVGAILPGKGLMPAKPGDADSVECVALAINRVREGKIFRAAMTFYGPIFQEEQEEHLRKLEQRFGGSEMKQYMYSMELYRSVAKELESLGY